MSEENESFEGHRGNYNRQMHDAVCSSCQKSCQVPFKPQEGRPVYCRECYKSRKRY